MYVRYVPICLPILVYPPNFRDGETEAPVGGRNLMEVSFGGCPMSLFSETVVETLGGSNEPASCLPSPLGCSTSSVGENITVSDALVFLKGKLSEFK